MSWTPTRRLARLLTWVATLVVLVLPTVGGRSQISLQSYEEEDLYACHGAALTSRVPRRAVRDPALRAAAASFGRELTAARLLPGFPEHHEDPFERGRTYLLCSRLLI